jgi:Ca2+-binding RTX toxin-like protein
MFGWFNNPSRAEPSLAKAKWARPRLERLEDRMTPAVGFDPATAQLFIFQTNGNDYATVLQDIFGNLYVNDNGAMSFFPAGQVRSIFYYGAGGNDFFGNASNIPCIAFGGFGADFLVGGSSQDFLNGNDLFVPGGDGVSDTLLGGLGPDVFVSEPAFFFGIPILNPFTFQIQNLEFTPDFNPLAGDIMI